MGQLPFVMATDGMADGLNLIVDGDMVISPLFVPDYISLNTVNFFVDHDATAKTFSYSFGLYWLNGSTLSLTNSGSVTVGHSNASVGGYIPITTFSATQNISPGQWWVGLLARTHQTANVSLKGNFDVAVENAFPRTFVGGRIPATTTALPATVATSDMDITGADALFIPNIVISA